VIVLALDSALGTKVLHIDRGAGGVDGLAVGALPVEERLQARLHFIRLVD
jgi:hypothetical protein